MDERSRREAEQPPWWHAVEPTHEDATPTEAFPAEHGEHAWITGPDAPTVPSDRRIDDEEARTLPLHLIDSEPDADGHPAGQPPFGGQPRQSAPSWAGPPGAFGPSGPSGQAGQGQSGASSASDSHGGSGEPGPSNAYGRPLDPGASARPAGPAPTGQQPIPGTYGPQGGAGPYGAPGVPAPTGQQPGPGAFGQAGGPVAFGQQPGPGAFGQAGGPVAFGQQPGPGAFGQQPGPGVSGQQSGQAAFGQGGGPVAFGNQSGQPSGQAPDGRPGGPGSYGHRGGPGVYGHDEGPTSNDRSFASDRPAFPTPSPYAQPGYGGPTGQAEGAGGTGALGTGQTAYGVPAPAGGALVPATGGSGGAAHYDPTGYGSDTSGGTLRVHRPQQVPIHDLRTVGDGFGGPPHPPNGVPGTSTRRRRGPALWIALTSAAVVVLLVAGALVAEVGFRAQTLDRVEKLAAALALTTDAGADVEGAFGAEILDGGSALLQTMGGTIDHLRLAAPDQRVDNGTLSTTFDLHDVPVGLDGNASRVDVTLAVDAEAVLDIIQPEVQDLGSDLYEVESIEADGSTVRVEYGSDLDIGFAYDLELSADGGDLVAQATNIAIVIYGTEIDVGDDEPTTVPLCEGSGRDGELTDVTVADGRVTFAWTVTDVEVKPSALAEAWSCV